MTTVSLTDAGTNDQCSNVSVAGLKELRTMTSAKERIELRNWLSPSFTPAPLSTFIEKLCEGTGSHFLNCKEYLVWRDGAEGLLWAYGRPGTGKTVLSAAVAQDLDTASSSSQSAVAYHFFSAERSHETLDGFLRHLALQFLDQADTVTEDVVNLWKKAKSTNSSLLPDEIISIISSTVNKTSVVYAVLDGLDECPFLAKLAKLLPKLSKTGLKIFATSRDLSDIRKHFDKSSHVEISATKDDLAHYIDWRLQEESEVDYDLIPQSFKSDLTSAVVNHVDGCFLVARLVMDHITSLTTIKKMRLALESPPVDYKEAYGRTMERIAKQNAGRKTLAVKVMVWICYAKRPLKLEELQQALATEDGEDEIDPENVESARSLLSCCLGLVVLSKADRTLGMVHETAMNFVRATDIVNEVEPNLLISQTCLTYLSINPMREGSCEKIEDLQSRLQHLPFLDYAAHFFGYHARAVEKQCLAKLGDFLRDNSLRGASWQVLHITSHRELDVATYMFRDIPRSELPLHVASYWGFSELVHDLLKANPQPLSDINAPDSHGWTPMHWAASMGHHAVVHALLQAGASANVRDAAHWTPLFWAAFKGHDKALSTLLNHGADCYGADRNGWTALHWAISAHHENCIDLLFHHMNQNPQPRDPSAVSISKTISLKALTVPQAKSIMASLHEETSLLSHAAKVEDLAAFRSLLDGAEALRLGKIRGAADANDNKKVTRANPAGTGIWAQEPPVRDLWRGLSKSDYMFWSGQHRKSPLKTFRKRMLHNAIEEGNYAIVAALLRLSRDLGLDLSRDSVNCGGLTYLQIALCKGQVRILDALLAAGADINAPDGRGGMTPLHIACMGNDRGMIERLLDCKGVDVNAVDKKGRTPLHTLLEYGASRASVDADVNVELCRLLLSRGALLDALDNDGNTALHMACKSWDVRLINFLNGQGCDVDAKNGMGLTVLHCLSMWDSVGSDHWYIHAYFERGDITIPQSANEEVMDRLLSLVDAAHLDAIGSLSDWGFDTQTGEYRQIPGDEYTPLALAIASREWNLAGRLMNLGARFYTTDSLQHLLYSSARNGQAAMVKLLLEHGSDSKTMMDPTYVNRGILEEVVGNAPVMAQCDGVEFSHDEEPNTQHSGSDYRMTIHCLLGAGADPKFEGYNESAIEASILRNVSVEILLQLLEGGADPYATSHCGYDAFSLALVQGSSEKLLRLLEFAKNHARQGHWLQVSPDFDLSQPGAGTQLVLGCLRQADLIDFEYKKGETMLHSAVSNANLNLAKSLLDHGADVNFEHAYYGTPLHRAIARIRRIHQAELGKEAREKSQLPNAVTYNTTVGKSELSFLTRDRYPWNRSTAGDRRLSIGDLVKIVQLLVDRGADLNAEGARFSKPLNMLLQVAPMEISSTALGLAQMLLDRGAPVAAVADNFTVEHVARFLGHEELWERLRDGISAGAEMKERPTILHTWVVPLDKDDTYGDIMEWRINR
ncbi:hypothetical protein, variant [Exophiala mesophila]|uniref:NACHT domain-containing protein n=1 Tax=Exophiala mesophila TaxID=212818 RepID=A0A0D2ACN6_EXOME|nr:hypothetical protein, variant [Exophiala mesophila]KIV96718.1 hypothetical protein, variant [Exophiala mesophila]